MRDRKLGMTDLLNMQDDPSCSDSNIESLRLAQVNLDESVLESFGWIGDIDPNTTSS